MIVEKGPRIRKNVIKDRGGLMFSSAKMQPMLLRFENGTFDTTSFQNTSFL